MLRYLWYWTIHYHYIIIIMSNVKMMAIRSCLIKILLEFKGRVANPKSGKNNVQSS